MIYLLLIIISITLIALYIVSSIIVMIGIFEDSKKLSNMGIILFFPSYFISYIILYIQNKIWEK